MWLRKREEAHPHLLVVARRGRGGWRSGGELPQGEDGARDALARVGGALGAAGRRRQQHLNKSEPRHWRHGRCLSRARVGCGQHRLREGGRVQRPPAASSER
eukprot:scaffold14003_cov78-Isochrysis_galbana.AAC.2